MHTCTLQAPISFYVSGFRNDDLHGTYVKSHPAQGYVRLGDEKRGPRTRATLFREGKEVTISLRDPVRRDVKAKYKGKEWVSGQWKERINGNWIDIEAKVSGVRMTKVPGLKMERGTRPRENLIIREGEGGSRRSQTGGVRLVGAVVAEGRIHLCQCIGM